jgi:hypothetical protein
MAFSNFFSSKYHGERGRGWGKGYTGTQMPKQISKLEFTVAKISLAYSSPILQILVDAGRVDCPRLTPNPKKLCIGGPVVSAKFQI